MKAMVVYDSMYGNTKKVAEAISKALGPEEEVEISQVGEVKPEQLAGLALLINVVTVAALSMPTPFQRFHPANVFVVEPPFVWLPLFLVQSALFGHVALLRRIRQMGETR